MVELSRAHEEHIRELLQGCELPRDAIPYSDEFPELKEQFWMRTFKKLTDAEFWQAIVNVAKKGGVRGKLAITGAPRLDEEPQRILKDLLPIPMGQRDRLPYTELFDKLVSRFNTITGLSLTHREVWLSILRIAK